MIKILADTSVWIDFLNNRDLPQVHVFAEYLQSTLVCSCPPIIQEVLQGVHKDNEYIQIKSLLLELEILSADPVQAAVESAEMFRLLRKKGVTIRKSNDCLIAWYAICDKMKLLQNDFDFQSIAKHTSLQLL
jgi:hypothetical protein